MDSYGKQLYSHIISRNIIGIVLMGNKMRIEDILRVNGYTIFVNIKWIHFFKTINAFHKLFKIIYSFVRIKFFFLST